MTEKFGDVLQFCSHLSKLMVTEIRRRASNQSTGNKFIALSIWNFLYQLKFVKINFHWHFKNTHNHEETITSVFMILFLHNWHIVMSGGIVYRSRQLCHRQFPGNGLLRDHWEWLVAADGPQSPVLWEPSPDWLYDRCLPSLHPGQVSLSVLWPARNRGTGRIQSQRRLSRRGEAHIVAENLCSGLHLFLCWFIYQTITVRDFDNWSM